MKVNEKGFSIMLSNENFGLQIAKITKLEEARTYAQWVKRNLLDKSPYMFIMIYPDDLSLESERV